MYFSRTWCESCGHPANWTTSRKCVDGVQRWPTVWKGPTLNFCFVEGESMKNPLLKTEESKLNICHQVFAWVLGIIIPVPLNKKSSYQAQDCNSDTPTLARGKGLSSFGRAAWFAAVLSFSQKYSIISKGKKSQLHGHCYRISLRICAASSSAQGCHFNLPSSWVYIQLRLKDKLCQKNW